MMYKFFIVCLLALVLVAPMGASAQTLTQEQINAQLQTVLNQLLAQVTELMKQLMALQTQQAEDSQKITQIQSSVTVLPAQQSFGSVSAPAPSVPSISFGTPYCNENGNALIPFSISGSDWKYGDVLYEKENSKGGTQFDTSANTRELWAHNNLGTTTLTTRFGKTKGGAYKANLVTEYTFTNTIFIGDVCQ
jgi:hypothetical protein